MHSTTPLSVADKNPARKYFCGLQIVIPGLGVYDCELYVCKRNMHAVPGFISCVRQHFMKRINKFKDIFFCLNSVN